MQIPDPCPLPRYSFELGVFFFLFKLLRFQDHWQECKAEELCHGTHEGLHPMKLSEFPCPFVGK